MGEPFGPFELRKLLGRGGMAEAFIASHRGEDDRFILKRVRPEHARSREYERRFLLEAQVAARAQHPNLARFREFGRVGDCFYLTMDQIRGWSLHRFQPLIFDQGLIPPLEVSVHLSIGILAGLSALHRLTDEAGHVRPMVHRDVNPKNIIVATDGEAGLIDFGIAKDVYGPAITLPGQLIGTARYMAPEHRRAEFLDPRADVFSAAVILFELMTGEHPWPPQTTVLEVMRTVFDPPELSAAARARVPDDVMKVVLRGLECERDRRYSDADEMANALRAAFAPDKGAAAVRAWTEEAALELDEQLAAPVLDVRSSERGGEDAEVFWTDEGTLSCEDSSEPPRAASVLALPPLPPRRDAALDAQSTRELMSVVERRSLRPVLMLLGAFALLAGLALFVVR